MKQLLIALLAFGTIGAAMSSAQTTNVTWQGGTVSNSGTTYNAQFTTIDGYTTNAAIGYAGNVNIVNGNTLWEIFLPDPGTCSIPRNPDGSCSGESFPDFPNNGKLSCESQITWGAKQWGTRSDGSTMNGTKAGDYYTLSGTTGCTLWNGAVTISLTLFHEFDPHTSCGRFGCHTYLIDTIKNGSGFASCVPGSGSFGACGSSQ